VARIDSRQAFQPVAARDDRVLNTPVLQLREHVHPLPRAFPAGVPDPHAQYVPVPVQVDAECHVDGPVADRAGTDLQNDRVDQDHRVDAAVSIGGCES